MREPCPRCRTVVNWAVTPDGREIGLNPEPSPAGEWRLASAPRGKLPRAVRIPEHNRDRMAGELMLDHAVTCPRRRRRLPCSLLLEGLAKLLTKPLKGV